MAYNTKEVLKDVDGNPISQYYNPDTDSYEPVEGSSGGNKVVVENNQGLSLIPILDKLSQLTGTVIDEETRKSNENQRVVDEDIRKSNEDARISSELARESNESVRESQENTRQSQESIRQSNEAIRESQESIRESNETLRIALYDDLQSKVASGFFKGEKGDTGNGLEYTWNGTQLGVRVEGTTEYVFVDLKGEKGDTGDIANLTSNHVTTALGYSPISPTQLNDKVKTDVPLNAKFTDTITTINGKTGAITKADIVALGIPASDTNTTYAEITTAEIDAGTSSTLRTITARRLKYLLDKIVALFPTKTSELTNDSGFLTSVSKADVGLGNVDNTSDLNKPISTATQTALDSKVDNSRVLTDVPLNAEFTDTITTINGKTGAITKADIVALGIPSQDTTYGVVTTSINGLMSATDKSKLDGIETGANNYVHPAGTNPHGTTKSDVGLGNVDNVKQASKTEFDGHNNDATRHITSVERTKWNTVDNKVDKVTGKGLSTNDYTTAEKNKLAGVEAGAQVNTVTSVAGKTGAVAVSKSDVGLGNVDNIKQMPISNGVLENYREKLVTLSGTSTAINLSLGNVFTHTLTGNTTYSITNAVNGQAHSFTLIINMGATVRTITFPSSIKWQGGEIPDLTTVNKTYVLTFMTVDGGTTWLGMFGGEF